MSNLLYRSILGSRIDATSYTDACDRIQSWVFSKASCYVIAANVHVIMTAYWQRAYQNVVNEAALVTSDGMPLVWGLRWLGIKKQQRVYGPDLMLAVCERAEKTGIPIFMYGGTDTMLEKMQHNLKERFPLLKISGSYAPPFRPLTADEESADLQRIQASGARIVFVGLGCPKQEQWMNRQQGKMAVVMLGVGAAFSFLSGEVSQAPRWMMARGMEWLYRLVTEPRRLWQRYLVNNTAFIFLFAWQLLRGRLKIKLAIMKQRRAD